MKLKVLYEDSLLTFVEDGQMLTLNCAGLKGKSDIVIKTIADREQLSAPIISLDGSILTITDTSGDAESYIIYSNGTEKASVTDTTVDISGIVNIEYGTRSITVVAESIGYENSEMSNAVEYRVGVEISGTWLIDKQPSAYKNLTQNVKFSSGSRSYSKFVTEFEAGFGLLVTIYYDSTPVYLYL